MSANKQIRMLEELQSLVEKQVELARQGNSASEQTESLSRRADCLAQKIAQAGILERAELKGRREKLRKSFDSLQLALTAQKADVAEKLSQVRKGRKIVETYRSNIQL